MLIASEHLGEIDVAEERLIEVPEGILGFPDWTKYAVIEAEPSGVYVWLQAVDRADLSFLAVVPSPFFPDYEPEIPEEDCTALELVDPEHAQLLCLVTIQESSATANLMGPLVLNVLNRQARQVVLTDSKLTSAEPIVPHG